MVESFPRYGTSGTLESTSVQVVLVAVRGDCGSIGCHVISLPASTFLGKAHGQTKIVIAEVH